LKFLPVLPLLESRILSVPQSTDSLILDGNLSELPRLTAETARFCRQHLLGEEVEFHLNLVLEGSPRRNWQPVGSASGCCAT
jgi:hypothetical protein